MTDNEIIKALESHAERVCFDCPLYMDDDTCGSKMCKEAIDLITRQKAEIEALYKINAKSEEEISELRKELLKRQNLEESFSKTTKQFDKKLARTVKLERAEAIKEFAERLKEEASFECDVSLSYGRPCYEDAVPIIAIDNLVKEMVGE